jgi:hypothetical protein
MKTTKRKIAEIAALIIILAGATGCSQLDVVGKESKTSFAAVLEAMPGKIGVYEMTGAWSLSAPDGQAEFLWAPDYSASGMHDIMLVFDAKPFIAAGLAPDKLPDDYFYYEDKITIGTKFNGEKLSYSGQATPLASYEKLVDTHRNLIGYHAALDHYGVTVNEGSLFEWAKDMSKNDKDIVFVLNPEPFIAAGVKPASVEGWVFDKVPVDIDGKPTEVDKFLKPFNLR